MPFNINFSPEHPTGYVPRHGGCGQDLTWPACAGNS